ncbi:peptide-methionine (S)-S-oxide reductase [Gramella sp. MAR_2010_147]|uniref:peptide-methionine (S)-S-oxide reductase n=1 Tax=Gramella sp. MAR_2010_147 TaxID=1250205 RepID=UPI00087B2D62|nr:peptide-methionine (S)-S-oxide reductase [Gramella sp. MAR_2010_147]SDR79423.1 peptide-methionine (S)-S-oxide reductase [Gramella sp. MAR_2010_147]
MNKEVEKIGFGGGCHWCTEAVFQSLKGVEKVDQGYVSTTMKPEKFSEGVLVYFNPDVIGLKKLVEIHLRTHKSTSDHSMRSKYLSAIYVFSHLQYHEVNSKLLEFEINPKNKIITKAYFFGSFKTSREEIKNYYQTDPERPFCTKYIEPKLAILQDQYQKYLK